MKIARLLPAALLLGGLCASAWADGPTTRPAPPTPAFLRKSSATVDQVYRKDLAEARTTQEKSALAHRILDAADEERDPFAKYALLTKAQTVAEDGGDAATVLAAADRIEKEWDVDGVKLRMTALSRTVRALGTPEEHTAFARLVQKVIERAAAEKRYDIAAQLNEMARNAAREGGDAELAKQFVAQGGALVERRTAQARLNSALAMLKSRPDDPAAETAAGKAECFVDDNWSDGLLRLSKGSDLKLRDLAKRELAGPTEPAAQVSIADGWWAVSEYESNLAKRQIRAHAASLYQQASANLSGEVQQRVQRRLAEAAGDKAPTISVADANSAGGDMPTAPSEPQRPEERALDPIPVQNLTNLPEAEQVIAGAQRDFPNVMRDVHQAALLAFRNGSDFTHATGSTRKMQDSFSITPSVASSSSFLFWGVSQQWPVGKFLVVYRVQVLSPLLGGDVFTVDTYMKDGDLGRNRVKTKQLEENRWIFVPMVVTVHEAASAESRMYAAKDVTVALDRVYYYRIE